MCLKKHTHPSISWSVPPRHTARFFRGFLSVWSPKSTHPLPCIPRVSRSSGPLPSRTRGPPKGLHPACTPEGLQGARCGAGRPGEGGCGPAQVWGPQPARGATENTPPPAAPVPGRSGCTHLPGRAPGGAHTCPAALAAAAPARPPPRTHLARDARDERHLPGPAGLGVPGALGAGAAGLRVCHVPGACGGAGQGGAEAAKPGRGGGGTWGCARARAASPQAAGNSLTGSLGKRARGAGRARGGGRKGAGRGRGLPGGRRVARQLETLPRRRRQAPPPCGRAVVGRGLGSAPPR